MDVGALDSSPATRMCLPGPVLLQCIVARLHHSLQSSCRPCTLPTLPVQHRAITL
jgi:hypothetical protein